MPSCRKPVHSIFEPAPSRNDFYYPYVPVRCQCGSLVCHDWHIQGVAQVQGVKFTKEQADLVCKALNAEYEGRPR